MSAEFNGATVYIALFLLIDIVVVFLTIFLVCKLKNKLGVYICWVPSFISLLLVFIMLFIDAWSSLYIFIIFFAPFFISYAVTAIIKLNSEKRKAEKQKHEKEELDKITIKDL